MKEVASACRLLQHTLSVMKRREGDAHLSEVIVIQIEHALTQGAEAADEVVRLRRDCAEAYQVVGSGMHGEPVAYSAEDVVRALDNLSAAANGTPRPHDDLLPWPKAGAPAPAAERVALTDDEILAIAKAQAGNYSADKSWVLSLARAVEQRCR